MTSEGNKKRSGMQYYTKRKFQKPELIAQCSVAEWARAREKAKDLPGIDMLYAVQNGARTSMSTAVALKKSGGKPGVPDLCLPVSRCGYHGLYVEMKAPSGKLAKNQIAYQKRLIEEGYRVIVCWNSADAVREIFNYLIMHDGLKI